ncbi:MAG TPA: M48 family metalloprotease [Candidatus Acidoferrales bacterium]|nr:M48 family metalloprotease [Candidatus Acidoferrales bacterium]
MRIHPGKKQSSPLRRAAICLAICFAAGLTVLAVTAPPPFPDPGRAPMSRDQQEKLGLQAATQVYQQMPVLPDSSPETQYIQALGNRLVAVIPKDRTWPYQFHVVAQKEVNAFALPGGPMFVNVGTITAADNEAELAGVMAHEMGHVYMQHGAKQARKSEIAGIIGAIAGAVGGSAIGTGVQLGAGALLLKYSRADESQADAFGAILLWHAHYNPMALADFFKKIGANSNNGPQFLSDHPDPGNRQEAIQKQVQNWPPENYSADSAQFAEARKHAMAVHAYTAQEIASGAKSGRWKAENAKNGAVLAGAPANGNAAPAITVPAAPISAVQPSSKFKNTNVGGVTLDYPDNWQVISGQQSSVTIAPSAGVASGAIAYGVVIQSAKLSGSDNNPEQVTTEIAQSLESGDANMKQNGNVDSITVAGMRAGSLQLTTVSPMPGSDGKPQPERDWLVAVPRGGNAIFFVFVAPQANFDRLKPAFDRMLSSVRF